MDWYYANGEERKGPVNDEEMQRLAEVGVVTPETLVWRDGMASWEPRGGGSPPTLPVEATGGVAVCAACGRTLPGRDVFSLAGGDYCGACKPQILQRLQEGKPLANAADEEIRNKHIAHEASVKSIGTLYYIGGVALFFLGIAAVIASFGTSEGLPQLIVGALLFAFGVGQFWTGFGLRRLRKWARIPTGILSGIGLLGFPIGTLINAYILYLVFSEKGATVFSEEYQAVVAHTPHIKYRTSVLVWIVLGLVLLVIVAGIIAAVASKR